MEYRQLGRTGVKVTPLCLGCMMFGGKTEPEPSMDIIDRAIDAGINFVDTANVYSRGRSEEVTGDALKRNGKRDRIILATKVHGRMADDDPNMMGNSRRHIIQQCDASLKRLKTDWIDLYQIHRPRSETPFDETLRALDDLIRTGKVRYIGTSTFAAWQFVESLWISKELGLNRFVSEQPPYNLLDRRIERELLPMARSHGVAVIPWSPLGQGFLTGKYERNQPAAEGWRLSPDHFRTKAVLESSQTFDIVDVLKAIAAEKGDGVNAGHIALAWCMARPGITSPIIGPRTMEQLEDNLKAVDVVLTEQDNNRLDEVSPPGGMVAPYYNADFGPAQYPWP